MTIGYGIGLIMAWSVLWGWTLIVGFVERERGARLEGRRSDGDDGGGNSKVNSRDDGSELVNGEVGDGLRRRRDRKTVDETQDTEDDRDGGKSRFKWQRLPPTLWHRVDWVVDLVTNFRGVRWSHQLSGLPYPDVSSPSAFAEPISHQSSTVTISSPKSCPSRYPTPSALLRYNLVNFLVMFIAIDIIKLIMLKDPYYWGLSNLSPSPFPLPRTSRMYLSLATLFTTLNIIFVLLPIVVSSAAGDRFLGEHAWPWLYPPLFGSPKKLWTHGLAGFWGGWWHPMFRLAFEQLGEAVVKPLGWEKKTVTGEILRVVLAFVASGTLHACGSYTSLGETQPSQELLFFAVQPVGLLTQRALAQWMKKNGLRDQIPAAVRGAANLAFVVAWFWLTAPLAADDFAQSGVWLYEPFPISPSRGLAGDGWWRWGGSWCRWHSDEKWWKSGLAF